MIREPAPRSPFWRDQYVIGTVVLIAIVVTVIVTVFTSVQMSNTNQLNMRDQQIQTAHNETDRLIIGYSKLLQQDNALGITPNAPTLAQVITGSNAAAPIPLPKSFTAAFPGGRFTCTDKSGEGNYLCTVEKQPPAGSPSTTHP